LFRKNSFAEIKTKALRWALTGDDQGSDDEPLDLNDLTEVGS
jgi:hypothetical protein